VSQAWTQDQEISLMELSSLTPTLDFDNDSFGPSFKVLACALSDIQAGNLCVVGVVLIHHRILGFLFEEHWNLKHLVVSSLVVMHQSGNILKGGGVISTS
jgi:hypothetical protein